MKKQGISQTIGVLVIAAAVLLFAFFRLTQSAGQRKEQPLEKTELEQLMEYDFVNEYPKTVRDVMKLYMRYLDYIYSEDVSEEQLAVLNGQMRNLYANELLNYNSEDTQLNALKEELAAYAKEKIIFVGYTMTEASQISYDTVEDKEYAKLSIVMNMKAKSSSADKEQDYVLEKNEIGQWKIYGWVLNMNNSMSGQ
ncbi:MAG: hypothetical protein K2G89_05270 [Lachnospiraceae bacterium]|nr:hypothetical protein [Lachnospiraceae bacterium]